MLKPQALLLIAVVSAAARPVEPLANDYVAIHESPDPDQVILYSPGIARLDDGRLVATMDVRGTEEAVNDWSGPMWERPGRNDYWQGRVYTSDDGGQSWTLRKKYPFMHARPFVAGDAVYVLGQADDLTIIRSEDNGETWSEPTQLTEGQHWHQAPSNVHYAHGKVYLVMERRVRNDIRAWYVGELAPVLMRGDVNDDLTQEENWTFASELVFEDVVKPGDLDYFGVPFFESKSDKGYLVATGPGRRMDPIGWLEANVVRIQDPDHFWYDPKGQTFHIWMRAHTGGTGYAAIAKVVEQGDEPGTGAMKTQLETVPSGKTMLFAPCPGGQMKFHVLYDEPTQLYWLLSTQATDSMTRPERLPDDRYNLPNNERRRLQLHFSKNMIDWQFAGLVAVGPDNNASRHYASMVIDGDDLHVLSRSGDSRAKSAHDGNIITFHTIKDFRKLVY